MLRREVLALALTTVPLLGWAGGGKTVELDITGLT